MFDTRAFKQAVLSKAMQGKLTQQLPEDGNASDLLNSIKDEKQRLIKEDKIKKQKPLPDIDPDEIPFKIPDSWQWVRLNDIGQWKAGSTPRRDHPEYYNGDIPWLKTGDLNDHVVNNTSESITKEGLNHSSLTINPVGSVLIAMYGATIAKLGILKIPATTNQACCACVTYDDIDNKFLFYYLMSQRRNFIALGAGGAQPNISRTKIIHYLIPLPPLAEQQRIVSQIDKCFKLADSIDDEHELNRNFSTNMHTSLLNAAMQGKLTKQLPEDGNASDLLNSIKDEKQRLIDEGKIKKQKPLPDIDPDDVPFEIPDNWQWVRIPEVSTFPEQKTVKSSDISGDTWVLDLKDIEKNTGKINHKNYNKDSKVKSNKVIFNKGDVLYNKLRPYLNKVIVAPDSGVATSELFVITPFDGINANYLSLVLRSPFFLSKINSDTYGTKMPRAGTKNFIKYLIPLPPFLEQQRIVSKLNSLFSKLNRI